MKHVNDTPAMLELMHQSAFTVRGGLVEYANQAALHCMITPGTAVDSLIDTGHEEYAEFSSGCLYLTLLVEQHRYGASVTAMDGFDVFVLDGEQSQPQLQAMALAARELRGPLSTMFILADRLSDAQDPAVQQQSKRLNQSLYQMLRLVSNMSDADRYTNETAPRLELQDMQALFGEIFEKATALTAHTKATLRFTNLTESVTSLANAERLERAVYNILSNALKFSPPDGVIDARLTSVGNKLYLTITDSGSGISNELMGSIYTRYLRQPCVEEGRLGIGLGMVLIRNAALVHKGTVLVTRTETGGTQLTLSLAIQKPMEGAFQSPRLTFDYAGEYDHSRLELADFLPAELYETL